MSKFKTFDQIYGDMTKKRMVQISKMSLVVVSCVLNTSIYSQTTWTNQVYKPDVAKIEYNPMKGLIPGYSGINSTFPYSTDHFYIDLKSTFTDWNTYNWSTFDANLNNITSRGCHAIARFWIDYPNKTYGMPTFLQSLVPAEDYTAMGNTVGKSKLPNWNNETLMTALEQFIAAFGARYDGDPRIIMIEAGLYGFWGEWHTSGTSGKEMNQINKDRIINAYLNAFTKTHIGLRQANHPSTVDLAKKVGYYDDSFCKSTLCTGGVWCFMYSLKGRGLTENYKYHPMGGEVYPGIQQFLFDAWPNSGTDQEDITRCVTESHMSFNKCFYLFKQVPTATQFANGLKMHNMMGYRFFVHSTKISPIDPTHFNLSVNLQNLGVAPIYYNWQVEFSAINSAGQWISNIGTADWQTNTLYPSTTAMYLKTFDGTLPTKDIYKILMRLKNPLDALTSNAKVLRFANEKQDADKDGWLTVGTFDGNAPINSIEEVGEQKQVRIYHNSATNKLSIESERGNMKEVSIYSILGKLVFTKIINDSKVEIDIKQLNIRDLILVKINTNDKTTLHKILIN